MITALSFSGTTPSCPAFSNQWAGLLPSVSSCSRLRWAVPITKINRFGTHTCSKGARNAQNRGGIICCLQKPRYDETSVEQDQDADTVPAPLGSEHGGDSHVNYSVGQPSILPFLGLPRLGAADQAFVLLSFIACTITVAFVSLIVTTIPTLNAMRRAALSLEMLADTARAELPGTMAAIRLSGMEISDLTVELSDLSQEISDGVRKSAQAVQAAEVGIRRIGILASSKAIAMLEERANLPVITIKPVVASAAETTSDVVRRAQRALMHIISKSHFSSRRGVNKSEIL